MRSLEGPAEGVIFKARDIYCTNVVQATGEPYVWCLSKGASHARERGGVAVDAIVFADDPEDYCGPKQGYVCLYVDTRDLEVVPEDEVPDEVWAKLALYKLTGDAS